MKFVKFFRSWSACLMILLLVAALAGCGAQNSGAGNQGAGLTLAENIPLPNPDDAAKYEIRIDRAGTGNLMYGWNTFYPPSPINRKFSSIYLTYASQTQLLKAGAAAGWIESAILYYQRRWYQLDVSNDDNFFQPGIRYWLWCKKKGTILDFSKPCLSAVTPTTAATGDAVTLTGINFGATQGSVTFYNGKSAAITSWNNSQIVSTVPAGAESGNVTATTSGGQTSNSVNITIIIPGTLKWGYPVIYGACSPALGTNGTIYFGASDNYLYALNPDGSLKWRYLTGGSIFSSPAIGTDGTIYVGSNDGRLYALTDQGNSASLQWNFLTGGSIWSSPAIGYNGTIYLGSNDRNLYAFRPDGVLKWSYLTGTYVGDYVESSPAIGTDGTIYFGSDDGKLYALTDQGNSASEKWSYPTGSCIYSSPAIGSDGTVYVGSYDCNFYAIKPDGALKWSHPLGGGVYYSSPAIASDGTIYFGTDDRNLYALNSDGSLKWTFATGGDMSLSSPSIGSDGTIYVGSDDRNFYALTDLGTSAAVRWSYLTGSWIESAPAIGNDGTIYFGSSDHILYALYGSGTLANTPWPMFRRNVLHTGRQ